MVNFQLLDAASIVLTGGSAGAQGVTWNCDFFAEWVWAHNPAVDVRCMPNAPEYYPPQAGSYSILCFIKIGKWKLNKTHDTRFTLRTVTPESRTIKTSLASSGGGSRMNPVSSSLRRAVLRMSGSCAG